MDEWAISGGNLDYPSNAHENGCEWETAHGNLNYRSSAHENGCLWHKNEDKRWELAMFDPNYLKRRDAKRRLAKWRRFVLITLPVAMYWMEETAKKGCDEGGVLRKRDLQLFIDECSWM
jgi:hypothetical protein